MAQVVKNLPAMQETQVQSLGQEDPLEKGMATHSSIHDWRIPWTEEPASLQSMRSRRVRHNWMTNTLIVDFTMLCLFVLITLCTARWFSYTCILFYVLFRYGLSQDTEYSFLCSAVGPCSLSILYVIVFICQSLTPNPCNLLPSLPWQLQVCSLCL